MSIFCKDINGNELEKLYQWDMGQQIILLGVESYGETYFHFSNEQCGDVYVGNYIADNDEYLVEVPNILLQEDKPIRLYIYNQTSDSVAFTTQMICIPVVPRPKPFGYIYENNADYVRYEDLNADVRELREMIESITNGSNGAVIYSDSQYLDSTAKSTAKNNIGIFVSDNEPENASDGDLWVNTSENVATVSNVHLVDVGSGDLSSIDFSKFNVGDICI